MNEKGASAKGVMTAETIRRLVADDWQAYRSIRLESLTAAPAAFGTGLEQEADWPEARWRERLGGEGAIFAAFAGDRSVGMAGWIRQAAARLRHRGYVWGVYVGADRRGGGLARRLVEAVIEDASATVGFLDLHVLTENVAATRLYLSLGFEVVGRIPKAHRLGDVDYDEYVMARG